MSQIEVSQLAVASEDWENFVLSIERLMTVHKRMLERLREMKSKNRALRAELRSLRVSSGKPAGVKICENCGNAVEGLAYFCDHCGAAIFKCECGRELSRADRFCDFCGRPTS
jgi:hypothetical protein